MNRNHLLATTAGLAVVFGLAASASASPQFTLDPEAFGASGPSSVIATDLTLNADTLITFNGTSGIDTSFSESGVAEGLSFENGAAPVASGVSGLTNTYNLWATFTATGHYTSTTGSQENYVVDSVNWKLYGSVGPGGTEVAGSIGAGGTVTDPSITGATLIELASGSLISGSGTVAANGYSLSLLSTVLTNPLYTPPSSPAFFVAPVPFFQVAFDNWSANPGSPLTPCNGGTDLCVGITAQSGQFSFVVPEPASLTLLGGGLLGLGFVARRRKKKAASAA